MLNNLQRITIENPVDKIIGQIRNLISKGEVAPGDKLPPERKLADHLGVSRSQVRDAIRKLEFYGILKTLPQSGTFVSGIGIVALEGLITDVLELEEHDFLSLVETRILLEKKTSFDAALKRTPNDIIQLTNALAEYESKIKSGKSAVEEDLLFHIKIAEAGKNNVLKSLLMIITPDIVRNYNQLNICTKNSFLKNLEEHQVILSHICDQNPKKAAEAMELHLHDVYQFSKNMSE